MRRAATLGVVLPALSSAAAALFSSLAFADDSLVCRNSLVTVGMVAAEVVARCGEPKAKSVEDIPVRVRHPNGTIATAGVRHVERWTYDRGYGRFPALLTFEDGKLLSIELLTRP